MAVSMQIHLSAILGSVLVAYLTAHGDWLVGGIIFAICFGLIEGGVMLLLNWRRKGIRQEEQEFRHSLQAMSFSQARSGAFASLANLKSVILPTSSPSTAVPAVVRDVFSRYERVVFPAGDVLELGTAERGFVRVGHTFDGAELIVREADGSLFEWDGIDFPGVDAKPDYPSIFHWIVLTLSQPNS